LNEDYAGSKQYREGLTDLAPSIDYIYKRLPSVDKITRLLDAGCGKGEFLYFAHKKGYTVYGIDYSEVAVALSKKLMKEKHIKNAEIHRGDVCHLKYGSDFFDVIVSTDVIEHLNNAQAFLDLLNESYRTLKRGGALMAHTAPNRIYVNYFVKYYQRYVNFVLLNILYMISGSNRRIGLELRNAYDQIVHINEQTFWTLKAALARSKFTKFKIVLFSDPYKFNLLKLPYYIIAYLYPINKLPFVNRLLSNHFYVFARK